MSILTLGSKKEEKENFQSKRKKISNQRESKKRGERKFPIKEWEKAKRKERKFPTKEWEKVKKEEEEGKKAPDQGSKENRRNVQRGLWTGQYLNNTELSPSKQKRKETTTQSGPLPLIANQNPVR